MRDSKPREFVFESGLFIEVSLRSSDDDSRISDVDLPCLNAEADLPMAGSFDPSLQVRLTE